MQQFLCPQCGAEVRFESAAAVMVVCASCRSTLTRDGDAARKVGHLSAVFEDGSVIRIGTRGRSNGRGFGVVGRLRMQYDAGSWNEWFIVFDDGSSGWLSDASGQYAVTRQDDVIDVGTLPAFEELQAGARVQAGGVSYLVSDLRECRCIGGDGELPVQASDGWEARVADARHRERFITLDYSDVAVAVYAGNSTGIEFEPGTLRRKEDIEADSGRYRGKILTMDCPNCGGVVSIAAAMATQVVCPSCSSTLDCSGERAAVIEAQHRVARFRSTLSLGARGNFDVEYTILGIMRCEVPDDPGEADWTEYLLFSERRGYLWLVETEDGWQQVRVCDDWPEASTDLARATWQQRTWRRTYSYRSRVKDVFGAFNWRVARGDTTSISDFVNGNDTLTRESNAQEVTWSHAMPTSAATVASAFRLKSQVAKKRADNAAAELMVPAIFATMTLLILSGAITFFALLVSVGLIWAPVFLTGRYEGGA